MRYIQDLQKAGAADHPHIGRRGSRCTRTRAARVYEQPRRISLLTQLTECSDIFRLDITPVAFHLDQMESSIDPTPTINSPITCITQIAANPMSLRHERRQHQLLD
jgi:hypothetical protein